MTGTGVPETSSEGGSGSGEGSAYGAASLDGSGSGEGSVNGEGVGSVADSYIVTVPASESAKLFQGTWQQSLVFTLGAVRQTVAMPAVQVLPDPANPKKTLERQIADNLEAVIQGRSLPFQDIESSNLNGQQIVNMTSDELRKWLIFYKSKANAQDERATPGSPSQVRPFYQ